MASIKESEQYVRNYCERFDSIGEFIGAIESRKVNDGWGDCSSKKGGDGWSGTAKTLNDAYRMARYGDEGSTKGIEEHMCTQLKATADTAEGSKPKVRNYFVGGSPNVARAMMGLPRDMRQLHKLPSKVKCIEIVYNPSVLSNVSSDEIMERGSKVCAIVTMLERLGYSVKLSVMLDCNPRGDLGLDDDFGVIVSVKDYSECVDISRIAFTFANASFFRRIGFRWIETYPHYKESGKVYGYGGRATTMYGHMREVSKSDNFKFITSYDMRHREAVADWLKDNGFL